MASKRAIVIDLYDHTGAEEIEEILEEIRRIGIDGARLAPTAPTETRATRRIEREEENARTAIGELRRLLDNAEKALDSDLRVFAGVSGNPGFVEAALSVDAAVRARQLLYDVAPAPVEATS